MGREKYIKSLLFYLFRPGFIVLYISMKVKEARQYLEECLDSLNRVKGTNLKIVDQETLKTKPNARICDSVTFTLSLDPDIFFKLHTALWINIDECNKLVYQKALMESIWNQVKKEILKHNEQVILNSIKLPKITLNGLPDYNAVVGPRNEPIYIDPNAAYTKTDVDMTLDLEGYRLQQILKQHGDDLLVSGPINNSKIKEDWNF